SCSVWLGPTSHLRFCRKTSGRSSGTFFSALRFKQLQTTGDFTTISISICIRTSTTQLEALGSFFELAYQIQGQARFSSSIVSVLVAKGSSRGVRKINSASVTITSNSVPTFLLAFAS